MLNQVCYCVEMLALQYDRRMTVTGVLRICSCVTVIQGTGN